MKKWIGMIATLVLAVGCGSADSGDSNNGPSGVEGKGDGQLTIAECEAGFEAYQACPEVDPDTATIEELNASVACGEALLESPVWSCCERDALRDSQFCVARLEEGRELTCEIAYDDYQVCFLDESFHAGVCRNAFRVWDDEGWGCCDRLDTSLCEGPRNQANIEDDIELTARIREAGGYFWLSDLYDQTFPVDVIPGQLQDSLPLYRNPLASNWLGTGETYDLNDPEDVERVAEGLATHEIARRLPINYAVANFGEATLDAILLADAYLTFWETVEGRIVIATHFYAPRGTGIAVAEFWEHGPTFVLPDEQPCDVMTENELLEPGLGEVAFALDAVNGKPEDSCISAFFNRVDDPTSLELETYLAARYSSVTGDDSRINTIEAAYRLDTGGLDGLWIEMVETPSQQTIDLLGEDLEVRRTRVFLNDRGDLLLKYDDEACEREIGYHDTPRCAFELP